MSKCWRCNGSGRIRHPHHIEEMVEGAYMKFGLYSAQYKESMNGPLPDGQTRTVYHDEVRIAGENGSYEMVAPRSK